MRQDVNSASAVGYILTFVLLGLLIWAIFDPPLGEGGYGSPPMTIYRTVTKSDTVYVHDTVVVRKVALPKDDKDSVENAASDGL